MVALFPLMVTYPTAGVGTDVWSIVTAPVPPVFASVAVIVQKPGVVLAV